MNNGPGSLNRIYRLVWNEACGGFVAVAENANARGKRASARTAGALISSALLVGAAMAAGPQAPPVNALPVGGQVAAGQVQIDQSGNRMNISQASARAVLNWDSFNIGASAQVRFQQPNASAVALNRVTSADPTAIFGQLSANGQVMLINPNGIAFGASARVDAAGIAASTLKLSDADFLAGRYRFTRDGSTASVVNQGEIRAADGGYVALLAPEVRNEGVLQARLGTVALAAGDAVTFDLSGNSLLGVRVDPASVATLVENRQLIEAEGGQVLLSAGAAQRLAEQAIAGGAGATTLISDNGVMRLVSAGGEIKAGSGRVSLEGRVVDVSGTVTASGVHGGQIDVSADALLQSGALHAEGQAGQGGRIGVSATEVVQTAFATLSADGSAGGGIVRVEGARTGALGESAGRIYTSATFSARGTGTGAVGGQIDLSADSVQLRAATLNADGRTGGGRVRVGGGFQGKEGDLANALDVGINASTVLRADAVDSGNGGQVVVWSDGTTAFAGRIAARGGDAGGDGGQAEVSGRQGLAFAGSADLSAAHGGKGSLLLDPRDIVIDDAGATIASLSLDNPNAGTQAGFGSGVSTLGNGNVVITAPTASTAGVSRTGAVYLYNSRTGALLGQLRGSHANDQVGNGGITVLDNQNYLVKSTEWDPITATATTVDSVTTYSGGATYYSGNSGYYRLNSNVNGAAGAITWQSGTGSNGGAAAVVDASNSLVGDKTTNDRAANAAQTLLSNGNVVFSNAGWNNGRGAVTWMNAATGQLGDGSGGGVISAANSLVGTTPIRATALQEGGVWITGVDSAALTLHTYIAGAKGGTSDTPNVMGPGDEIGRSGVTVLAGGGYVVASPLWTNNAQAYVGAVTHGDANGTVGAVSTGNSLYGSSAFDFVGSLGVKTVGATDVNGLRSNYVVMSPYFGSGGQFLSTTATGAVTWVDGTTGFLQGGSSASDAIDSSNSLIGNASDRLGSASSGTTWFYTRSSDSWVPYNGGGGYYNSISQTPSSPRSYATQQGVTVLDDGNYLVTSTTTGGGKGSVTFGGGSAGSTGTLGSSNSLIGSGTGDSIGSGGILQLSGGRYVVNSPNWDGDGATDAGAVTWGSATGIVGVLSAANSLVGSTAYDRVGSGGVIGVGAKDANGRFDNALVLSPYWGSGSALSTTGKGAVSWINGVTGQLADSSGGGSVAAVNSLVGGSSGDYVGSFHASDSRNGGYTSTGVYTSAAAWSANLTATVDVLANGNFLVRSPSWSDGKGAATWGSGTAGAVGVVSADNSLVGSTSDVYAPQSGTATPAGDQTGRTFDTVTRTMTATGDHVGLQARSLSNGNVVVASPFWSDGRGAVTLVGGPTGEVVSASNSLVGSTPDTYTLDNSGGRIAVASSGDHIGINLYNPTNYVVPVISSLQGNSSTVVTTSMLLAPYQLGYLNPVTYSWNDPSYNPTSSYHYRPVTTGSNSSFSGFPSLTIDELANGNVLVRSPMWNNGSATRAGAVTWLNGSTGALGTGSVGGTVSTANSLVGSHTDDKAGLNAPLLLGNGNAVLGNSGWNVNRGAVSWINGATGQLSDGSLGGTVSEANSLVGSVADSITTLTGYHLVDGSYVYGDYQGPDGKGDRVGSGLTLLSDDDVVVSSSGWGKTGTNSAAKGAVSWISGATGQLVDTQAGGVVSAANSLVGSQGGDQIGSQGVTALANGRYVVNSPNWSNGAISYAGAVTWGDTGGVSGLVSSSNSLVGTHTYDMVGSNGITLLRDANATYTNYLVQSYMWNGYAGQVTWVDGSTGHAYGETGTGATVSAANSLVGTQRASGYIGLEVTALSIGDVTTGDALINSNYWSDCGLTGAITLMPGATGLAGEVGWRNSLLGLQGSASSNGGYAYLQYQVLPYAASAEEKVSNRVMVWTGGGNSRAAVLSVVDETAAQPLGTLGHSSLSLAAGDNANWSTAGFAADAAGFASLGGSNGTVGFSAFSGGNLVITPTLITSMLNAGTDVTLQASNDITVAKAVVANNPNGNGGDLTLQAGRAIHVNADVVTDNGQFTATANMSTDDGVVVADCGTCTAEITMKDGVKIDAGSGNVRLTVKTGSNSGDIVLGSVFGHSVQIVDEIGSIRTNTATAVDLKSDAAPGSELLLRAREQVVLGNDTVSQAVAIDAASITLEARGYDNAGSVQLTTGVALSGKTLAVRALDATVRTQIGDSSAGSAMNSGNGDFWLTDANVGRVFSQASGFDSITFGRADQMGVTDFRGADLSQAASSSIAVKGGAGGLLLSGSTTLAAGKTLTLADTGGSIATVGSFSVSNPAQGASALALRADGVITLANATLDLTGATLSIETGSSTPMTLDGATTLTADALRLKGVNAQFDLTAAAVQVGTLAADVRSLQLVNAGGLTVGSVGDVQGVTTQDGVLLEARGNSADLALDAAVNNTSGDTVLAAGRHFLNRTAFDTGINPGSGRFMVYSSNPVDSLEGVTVSAKRYNQTYTPGSAPAYAAGGSWFLYSVAPTLTVGAGNASAMYGTSDANSAVPSFGGFIDGDTLQTIGLTGNLPALNIAAGATSGAGYRAVGTYATSLAGDPSALASSLGYRFVTGAATGTYTVTQRDLTPGGTQVYDGTTRVAASQLTSLGALSGDAVQLTGEGGRDRNVGSNKTVTLDTLALSGADAANYRLAGATVTVTPRTLTVTADNQHKVYGDADPTLGFQVGGLGLASGDNQAAALSGALVTTTGAAATAGNHAITQGSLLASANYQIGTFNDGTLSVDKAVLTVTAGDRSKVVGAATPALGYTVNTAQLKYDDTASVVSGATLATAEGALATAGTHAITVRGSTAANYEVTEVDGTLTVNSNGLRAENLVTLISAAPATTVFVPPSSTAANVAAVSSTLQPGQVTVVAGGLQLSTPVLPNGVINAPLQAAMPLLTQSAVPGQAMLFTLPAGTFIQGTSMAKVSLEAQLADGLPLPAWLVFDAKTGQLAGTPPAGFSGKVMVQIRAVDASGAQVTTMVEVDVSSR